MRIKIYLLKANGKNSRFPAFTIDFENEAAALTAFGDLYQSLAIKNTEYIACKAAIFKRALFDKAILCWNGRLFYITSAWYNISVREIKTYSDTKFSVFRRFTKGSFYDII